MSRYYIFVLCNRQGVAVSLTCVVLLTVVVQGCAIAMTTATFNAKALPTERSALNNVVGQLLYK